MDQLKLPQVPKDQEILAMDLKLSDLKNNRAFVLPLHVETSRGKLPLWVTGKVSVFKETPVSKKLIRLGQVITENDFELREVDVSFVQDGVPSPKEVIERAASRLITAGEPIFFKDVKKIPDLFRGQTVKILVGTEEFEITTLGVAEEDGNLGDRIRVRSESIKKTVTGKIVEKGTVKIE
jgi:flagella basal body P-ring formation protein FlgA